MGEKRVPLYDRLPEIYRIKDLEQSPPGRLKSYLALVEEVFGEIHENIESLYHDLFIDTCDDWVIPYIGDLLGTSHLKGNSWTLRADVSDTIALRRRKGTIGAIELLTYNLTQWGVHCLELKENLVWNHHLNHQRPDRGTVPLGNPSMLTLVNTPFDPFGHTVDLKPPAFGNIRYNLPNLAIFLWRLEAYQIPVSQPDPQGAHTRDTAIDLVKFPDAAAFIARFNVHPLGEPVRLFNTHGFDPDRKPPVVTQLDETPGPIATARLNGDSQHGNPEAYVAVDTYDHTDPDLESLDISDAGLQMHLPESRFAGEIWPRPEDPQVWSLRGGNLCAWEKGLSPPLEDHEIVIDPVIGRIVFGVDTKAKANALIDHLLLTYTHGAVGPVGAHPLSCPSPPLEYHGEPVDKREVNYHQDPGGLLDRLDNIHTSGSPIVIEIQDSMTHHLDLTGLGGTIIEDGGVNLQLNRSLIIRAADNQRPVIRLAHPLGFRPANVKGANETEQNRFDAVMSHLTVRFEGLYLTRSDSFPGGKPLIARAALHSLEMIGCTLDPGGFKKHDGSRAPVFPSMELKEPYGFADGDDEDAFNQTPEIILRRVITGPLFMDTGYRLFLGDTIIDGGSGVGHGPGSPDFAVSGAGPAPSSSWGPATQANGVTVFGRMRVESISGRGGIWVHSLEVLNNQKGCIRFSCFSGRDDRLPRNIGCVNGKEARLRFVSEIFGRPAYGQLARTSDFRIREQGPRRTELRQSGSEFPAGGDPNYAVTFEGQKVYKLGDQMGAFGFLLEAHKWRNIQIRFREFMPVGVRPLLIQVT
ncbi:MAG: hypothetical protein GY737_18000 [Desulfobacteraceae bacterium]|nr:hypothetical protein [Desulfobacteraceae bacterium]